MNDFVTSAIVFASLFGATLLGCVCAPRFQRIF